MSSGLFFHIAEYVDISLLTDRSGLCLGFCGPEFTRHGEDGSWFKMVPEVS